MHLFKTHPETHIACRPTHTHTEKAIIEKIDTHGFGVYAYNLYKNGVIYGNLSNRIMYITIAFFQYDRLQIDIPGA